MNNSEQNENINEVLGSLVGIYGFKDKQEHFDWVNANFDKMVAFFEEKGLELNPVNIMTNKHQLDEYLASAETKDFSTEFETIKTDRKKQILLLAFVAVLVYLIFIR
jgi:hypothetical protein